MRFYKGGKWAFFVLINKWPFWGNSTLCWIWIKVHSDQYRQMSLRSILLFGQSGPTKICVKMYQWDENALLFNFQNLELKDSSNGWIQKLPQEKPLLRMNHLVVAGLQGSEDAHVLKVQLGHGVESDVAVLVRNILKLRLTRQNHLDHLGSGSGSVGRAVASNSRGPQFESIHR